MLDCYHFWAGLSKFEDLDLIRERRNPPRPLSGRARHSARACSTTARATFPAKASRRWCASCSKLAEKNYRGPLSVELFYPELQKGDPYEVAPRIRRKAEPILQQAGVL